MGNMVIVDDHKWEEIEDGIYKAIDRFTTTERELFKSDNYSRFNAVGDIVEGVGIGDGVLSPVYMCVKYSSVDRFDELVKSFLRNSIHLLVGFAQESRVLVEYLFEYDKRFGISNFARYFGN